MEEKVVAAVLDTVTLGRDGAVADEHVAEAALEVVTSPLSWKRTASSQQLVCSTRNESIRHTQDPWSPGA